MWILHERSGPRSVSDLFCVSKTEQVLSRWKQIPHHVPHAIRARLWTKLVVRDKFSQYFISVFAGSAVYNCVCVSLLFASGKGLTMLERDRRSTEDPPCPSHHVHVLAICSVAALDTMAFASPCFICSSPGLTFHTGHAVPLKLILSCMCVCVRVCVRVCVCVCVRERQTDRQADRQTESRVRCVCVSNNCGQIYSAESHRQGGKHHALQDQPKKCIP